MRQLLLCLLYCLLSGCQRENIKNGYITKSQPIIIKLDGTTQYISLDKVVDSIWSVTLNTNDSVASIELVDKILLINKKIFILDVRHASIKAFDLTGKYLHDIGGLGVKKGLFRKISDMSYNKYKNTIYVLCNAPAKTIFEYTIDGTFIRKISLENGATGLAIGDANSFYYYLNHGGEKAFENYNLVKTDSTYTHNEVYFNVPANIKTRIGFSGGIYTCNNLIYFNPPLTNNVYSVSRSGIGKTCYLINFGTDSLPSVFKSNDDLVLNHLKYSHLGKSFVEESEFVGFNYVEKGGWLKQAFYNKSTQNIAKTDITSPINDLFRYDIFQAHDTLMTTAYIRDLKNLVKKNGGMLKAKMPDLYKAITSQENKGNPVIIFYKLKKF